MKPKEKGTLEERIRNLKLRSSGLAIRTLTGILKSWEYHFGTDATMVVVMDILDIKDRSTDIKLAECAFDLVPGQINEVVRTSKPEVVLPRHVEMNMSWHDDGEEPVYIPMERIRLRLQRWMARAEFAFDPETGTLAVYDPNGGL